MSAEVVWFTRVKDGQFTSRKVRELIRSLEGKPVELTLRKRRSYRTDAQNRAFHGPVLGPITRRLRDLGWTGFDGVSPINAREVKEVLKKKFLTRSLVDPITGELFDIVRDTRNLTKADFADFLTDVIRWAESPDGLDMTDPETGRSYIVIGDEDADESFAVH